MRQKCARRYCEQIVRGVMADVQERGLGRGRRVCGKVRRQGAVYRRAVRSGRGV
ncbi:MAG: hypothetical protein ACLR4Z_10355 [Butyricicoccaceae bacterium]